MSQFTSSSPRLGLSLSGGGARGIAHLGVLQALEELHIRPDKIAGVSAGAIAGALYAHGYPPKEILRMVKQVSLFSFFNLSSLSQSGFLSMDSIEKLLFRYLPHDQFSFLQIPLVVSATDVQAGETVYFSEGALIKPILASACVPVVFSPVQYQGRQLVDGGIVCSMEVMPLQDCEKIIGVHTNPFNKNQSPQSTRALLERCLTLSIHANARANFRHCALVIEPSALRNIAATRLDRANELFQIGYQATMQVAADLEKIVAA
ncbi:MAG: patatin-like phospholipase family protein [Microscillaceae bacterium]